MLNEKGWFKKVEAVLFPPASFPPHSPLDTTEPTPPPSDMTLEQIHPYYHQYAKTNLSLPTLYENEESINTVSTTTLPPPQTPTQAIPSYYTTPSFATSFSYTTNSSSSSSTSSSDDDNSTAETDTSHANQHNHHAHDKNETSSSLKRLLLPHKTYYELEWPGPQHTTWIQLDEQTSKGIERVMKMGFADLQVPLNEQLTDYIHCLMHDDDVEGKVEDEQQQETNTKKKNILIDILFDYQTKHRNSSSNAQEKVQLLRLRRVHWWSKNYFMAQSTTTL